MKKMNKAAFTLLEVMLATAILVIASTMIMQGFMSTLAYSANTAIFAKDGADNSKEAYSNISSKAGKIEVASGSSSTLSVAGGSKAYNISVSTWKAADHSTYDLVNGHKEGSASANTANRYAVTYSLPLDMECPVCMSNEALARDANDAPDYKWFCTDCDVYIGE